MKTSSPKVLVEAALSPVQPLPPVWKRPLKVHEARPWKYQGVQTLAAPSKPRGGAASPQGWRFLSWVQKPNGYTLLSFATNDGLLKGDLRILGIPTGTQTWGLKLEEAMVLGERIEGAFRRLNK